ncbi:MAG: DedA family protein, partial [Deinococcus sp.]
ESIDAGQTTLLQAILWGVAGNWLGSLLGYQLARLALRRLPQSWQRAAHSRRTARLMRRWGGLLVVVSRTVGSLRTPVTLYAGASAFPWPLYLRASLLGALLHVGLWQTLLWRFGPGILHSSPQLRDRLLPYLAAVVVLALVWLFLRRRRRQEGEDGQAAERG